MTKSCRFNPMILYEDTRQLAGKRRNIAAYGLAHDMEIGRVLVDDLTGVIT
ncbi:MAG: hypothetical protein IKE24_04470 [Clostridia bacterium]|nr:hypothetical protein [Clostridia bacterium]